MGHQVNPVRKSSTFQREGSHGVLYPVFAPKEILSSSPLQAPLEVNSQRELLVNNEKFLTGQAAGLSNGVKVRTKVVNRKTLIETMIMAAFGLVTMVEALRLIIYKDPYVLYDPIGPGFYVLALSVGVLSVGVVHFAANYRKGSIVADAAARGRGMRQLFSSIIVLALYLLLINFVGYLIATLLFFLLQFRVTGVKSWRTNIILTLLFTAVYYVIFVRLCEMVFPREIF